MNSGTEPYLPQALSQISRSWFVPICLLLAACGGVVVHEVDSTYSHIRVTDYGSRRTLSFDRDIVQTMIDLKEPQRLQHAYTRAMMSGLLYEERPSSVLLIGLGGGAFVRFLNYYFPQAQVDAVELDPVVVQVARDYFGTREGPRTRIFTADGRDFLQRSTDRYDLILLDAHLHPRETTDSTGHPLSLQTEAFYRSLRDRLNPGGVVVFNLIEGADARAYVARIQSAFAGTDVLALPATRNLIVVAKPGGPLPTSEVLLARARKLDQQADYGFSFERLLELRQRPSLELRQRPS